MWLINPTPNRLLSVSLDISLTITQSLSYSLIPTPTSSNSLLFRCFYCLLSSLFSLLFPTLFTYHHTPNPLIITLLLSYTMEVSNAGISIFHRFQASFIHDGKGTLLFTSGPRKQLLEDNWEVINSFIHLQESTVRPANRIASIDINEPVEGLRLYQQCQLQDGVAKGLLLAAESKDNSVGEDFEYFFVQLILDQLDFALYNPTEAPSSPSPHVRVTGKIVSLFDSYLRYQGNEDKWEAGGRRVFEERVRHFTSQGAQIQLCLPAFPCKSTNTNKVTGTSPDRGEALALNHLHSFVEAVEKIYKPGAKLWVISDGHVFSDCIGVDDAVVDRYGEELKEMNREIGLARGRLDRVDFRSLVDLFKLTDDTVAEEVKSMAKSLRIPAITHHVRTKETEEAELCRQILMAGTQPLESVARDRLKSNDESLVALYRGFSRFMLEDLELHPTTLTQTKSQRKKLSTKVAFEMILVSSPPTPSTEPVLTIHSETRPIPTL